MTQYQLMRWQQENCTDQVLGYAAGLAAEITRRAAYMTGTGTGTEITNNERMAAANVV